MEQVSDNHFSVLISSYNHRVIGVEWESSRDVVGFLIYFVELLAHHIDDAEMAAEHALETAFRCGKAYFGAVSTAEDGICYLGSIYLVRSKWIQESVLFGDNLAVTSFG